MAKIRKIQTSVSTRGSKEGLARARQNYIERAIKSNRRAEIRFAYSKDFTQEYRKQVRNNIISKTNKAVDRIVNKQEIGSEGRKLLRKALSGNKLGTKATMNKVLKAEKFIKKKGVKQYVNRQGFVRGISRMERTNLSVNSLLKLQERTEFYFQERNSIVAYNKDRSNKSLERTIMTRYKKYKSEETNKFIMESEIFV